MGRNEEELKRAHMMRDFERYGRRAEEAEGDSAETCRYRHAFPGVGFGCTYGRSSVSWGNCPQCSAKICPLGRDVPETFMEAYQRRLHQVFNPGDVVYFVRYIIRWDLKENDTAVIVEPADSDHYNVRLANGDIVAVHRTEIEPLQPADAASEK